jgi:dolichol-phosphate mannosyltransferase
VAGDENLIAERPRLGVVVPMANEEETVDRLLAAVVADLRPDDKVFCVLDRVSTDHTRERVERFEDPRVHLVWHPEGTCVVDAYFRGYQEALDAGSGWILEMDAGFSHDPAQIPEFLAAMAGGADLAVGSRFAPGGSYDGRWARLVLSRGGTVVANRVLGTRMTDMTSGYECFTREALEHVVSRGVRSRAHFFQTEIRAMLHDWDWVEVPISYCNPSTAAGMGTVRESVRNLRLLRRDLKEHRLAQPVA